MKHFPVLLVASFIAFSSFRGFCASGNVFAAGGAPSEQCLSSWQSWKEKYAGSTPFASFNKTSSVPLDQKRLERIFKADSSVFQDIASMRGGIAIERPYAVWRASRFTENERGRQITAHIRQLVDRNAALNGEKGEGQPSEASSSKSLLLILTGWAHAGDYFFSTERAPVLYASFPLRAGSHQGTEDYLKYYQECIYDPARGKLALMERTIKNLVAFQKSGHGGSIQSKVAETVRELEKNREIAWHRLIDIQNRLDHLFYEPALFAQAGYWRISREWTEHPERVPPAKELLSAAIPESDAILLSGTHGINEISVVADLPDAACMKELGYGSVSAAFEGIEFDRAFSNAEVVAEFDSPSIGRSQGIREEFKKHCPQASSLVEKGDIYFFADLIAVLRKLSDYEKGGLSVQYQGLE